MTHAGDCDDMAKSIIRAGEILQQGAHKFSDEDGLASLGRLANHFVFCMALVSLAGNTASHLLALAIPGDASLRNYVARNVHTQSNIGADPGPRGYRHVLQLLQADS